MEAELILRQEPEITDTMAVRVEEEQLKIVEQLLQEEQVVLVIMAVQDFLIRIRGHQEVEVEQVQQVLMERLEQVVNYGKIRKGSTNKTNYNKRQGREGLCGFSI